MFTNILILRVRVGILRVGTIFGFFLRKSQYSKVIFMIMMGNWVQFLRGSLYDVLSRNALLVFSDSTQQSPTVFQSLNEFKLNLKMIRP